MKRFSLVFLGALVLMLAVVLPGYAYAGQPAATQGAASLSVDVAPAQGAVLNAVQADHSGQTLIAGKGDDDGDKHGDKDDDKHDDKNDDKNDDHDKTPEPTKTPEHNNDDDHDKTPEPTHTPDPGKDDEHRNPPDPTHPPGNDEMTPDPTHTPGPGAYQEFRGRIEAMNGNVWVIDGRTVMVTDRTRLEAKYGPLAVGSLVEVKAALRSDGVYVAAKIEAKRQSAMSGSDSSDDGMSNQAQAQTQAQMQTQSQSQTQTQTQAQTQLTAQQRQALQAVSALVEWLMKTFQLDLSQVMTLLQAQLQ